MAARVIGTNDGSALVAYPNNPQKVREGSRWKYVYRYWCAKASADSLIPAAWAACADNADLSLDTTEITPKAGAPGFVDVTLTYRRPGMPTSQSAGTSTTQKEASIDWQEVPIDDPRLETAGFYTADQIASLKAAGQTTVGVGGMEYHYTQYASSFTWSESNLVDGIGETGAPTGISGATPEKWLMAGMSVRDDGDVVEKRTTWKYHALGWKDEEATTTA